jgi:hypothetical protein
MKSRIRWWDARSPERRNVKFTYNFSVDNSWKVIPKKLRILERNIEMCLKEIDCEVGRGWNCLNIVIGFGTKEAKPSDSPTRESFG